MVFMTPRPLVQQIIGSMSDNDMKTSGYSDRPHCQVNVNIANVRDTLSPKLDISNGCSATCSSSMPTISRVESGVRFGEDLGSTNPRISSTSSMEAVTYIGFL